MSGSLPTPTFASVTLGGNATQNLQAPAFQQISTGVAPALNNIGRNYIHNPLFNIQQRGTGTFTTNGYTADRWQIGFGTGDAVGVAIAGVGDTYRGQIGDEAAIWLLSAGVTGASNAGSFVELTQKIEKVQRLSGKTITVSFYANSSVASFKVGVSIDQLFGTGGSPSASVTGNGTAVTLSSTATTFARYTATFTLPSAAGKTLGSNGDDSTQLNFWFSSGATNATRAGNIGVQSGTVNLWGVQLEVGSVATPLEKPDPQQDFSKCARFYTHLSTILIESYTSVALGNAYETIVYPTPMRAQPTVTVGSWSYTLNSQGGNAVNVTDVLVQLGIQATAAGRFNAQATNIIASADL